MEPNPGTVSNADGRSGVRVAARVLLIDPAQRLLLFHGVDPHHPEQPFWFTAGGGVEPGEGLLAAAGRELREETGMQVPPGRLVGRCGFDGSGSVLRAPTTTARSGSSSPS